MVQRIPNFQEILRIGGILGLDLPDSATVERAYDEAQGTADAWLFNHVARSWLYGATLAVRRGLKTDGEVLAVAALLHDVGLAQGGAPDRRFEILGADFGREFALTYSMGSERAEMIWDSIALHTTASIARHKSANVACCQAGVACDYGGVGYSELDDTEKSLILSAFPRLHMKEAMTKCLCEIAHRYPDTTRDNFIADFGERFVPGYKRSSPVEFLHSAPFAE